MHIRELFDLTGRIAVVTGGSRGLGLQVARAYGEAGATVLLVSRKQPDLHQAIAELTADGYGAAAFASDLSVPTGPAALTEQILAEYGRIDILVNNAGATWGAPAEDYPIDAWNKVMHLNLTSAFQLSQAVGRLSMLPRGSGKIINVASVAGLLGSEPKMMATIAYHSSKGGLINFTRALASEWAARGVHVNAIAPGFFPTKMTQGFIGANGDEYLHSVPLGRFGGNNDIKGVALLLASRASDYITGQTIVVDGGYSII